MARVKVSKCRGSGAGMVQRSALVGNCLVSLSDWVRALIAWGKDFSSVSLCVFCDRAGVKTSLWQYQGKSWCLTGSRVRVKGWRTTEQLPVGIWLYFIYTPLHHTCISFKQIGLLFKHALWYPIWLWSHGPFVDVRVDLTISPSYCQTLALVNWHHWSSGSLTLARVFQVKMDPS